MNKADVILMMKDVLTLPCSPGVTSIMVLPRVNFKALKQYVRKLNCILKNIGAIESLNQKQI